MVLKMLKLCNQRLKLSMCLLLRILHMLLIICKKHQGKKNLVSTCRVEKMLLIQRHIKKYILIKNLSRLIRLGVQKWYHRNKDSQVKDKLFSKKKHRKRHPNLNSNWMNLGSQSLGMSLIIPKKMLKGKESIWEILDRQRPKSWRIPLMVIFKI